MKELHVKRFCGTVDAPMIPSNACCDFVNDNKGIDVVQIAHSNNDVFLYYRGDSKEDKITPRKF